MKKRFLAMLLVVLMIVNIIPTSVFAEEVLPEVIYGYYGDDGKFVETGDPTYTDDETGIKVSKVAEPINDGTNNKYKITLTVETSTVTSKVAAPAATVLVIDVSGSMDYCVDCKTSQGFWGGSSHSKDCVHYNYFDNSVKASQSRMTAAKAAAIDFLDSYKVAPEGSGRWVSIVAFATNGNVVRDWVDVTKTEGYNSAVGTINALYADGGTNLEQGLSKASEQFKKDAVSGLENKFTVALTDGVPTYAYAKNRIGNGSSGSEDVNNATAATASALRNNCDKLYTVCVGVADQTCYNGGPTVGDFLAGSVATSKDCAFNANNAAELYSAFANITKDITSGLALDGSDVDDTMGEVVDSFTVTDVTTTDDSFTWTLSNPNTVTSEGEDGSKVITYTYTKSYEVNLADAIAEANPDGYYPLNEEAYLTIDEDTVIYFPVPAVRPLYTVTYAPGAHGTLEGQTEFTGLERYSKTPDAPKVNPDADHYFVGWAEENDGSPIAPTVTKSVTYVAQYAEKSEIVITGESDTVDYNGAEQVLTGYTAPDGMTVTGITYKAAGTDVGTYTGKFDGTPVITVDGVDVTNQYKVKYVPGTLTINPLAVTVDISGNTDTKSYTGAEQAVTGYEVTAVSSALYSESNIEFTGDAAAKGTNVGTYHMGLTAEQFENTNTNFTVTFNVTDGALTITRATNAKIEVSAYNNVYDGAEHNALTSVVLTDGNGNVLNNEDWTITYVVDGKESADMPTIKDVSEKTVTVKATNPNYDPLEAPATAKVTPKAVTLTSASADKFYDGTPLVKEEVTAEGFVTGEGATYNVTGSQTLAGSSKNTFTYKLNDNTLADNYDITTIEGTLTVAKKGEIVVTITENSGVYTYDGTEKAVKGYTVSISDPLYTEEDFEFEGEALVTGTYVGEYDMELTPENFVNINENFENVTFVIVDGTLVIKPIETVIDITADSNEKIYDGTALTDDGYTFTENVLVEGDELVVVVEGTITDAGTVENKIVSYQVLRTAVEQRATVDVTDCYTFGEITDGTLTVKPREVVITSGSDTKVYDGTPLTNCDIAAEGFVKGEGAMVTFTGSQLNAGISENTFTFVFAENTKAQNYTVIVVNGKLEVTPKAVTITSGSANKHYDGEPLTCDQITAEGFVEGEGAEYDITGSQTEVGTGKNTFTYKMKDNTLAENYTVTLVEGDLLVLPPIEIPNTGDNTNLVLYAGMMVASAAAFVTLLVAGKKKGKYAA